MPVATARPASDKQAAFITRLATEKDGAADVIAATFIATMSGDVTELTTQEASTLIDTLMRLPRAAAVHTDGEAVTPGLYVLDGRTYKVQAARATGNLYAKVLYQDDATEAGWWSYAPGAMRQLVTARRLTVEEAAAYGRATGTCVVCGRTLTDPESIAAGIGPICAGRMA